ncbi:MAG TPA: tetratricopeptide repeat protein [Bacteroidota bacterium]
MKPIRFIILFCTFASTAHNAKAFPDVPHDSVTTLVGDSLFQTGVRKYSEARYEDAVRILSEIPRDTSSSQTLFYLGLSYASMNDFQNAYDCLKNAVALDSINLGLRYQYAKFLGQNGASDEAQKQYESIIQSDTTFYPAYFQLGVLINAQRKFPQREVEIFSRIVRDQPRDYLSLHFLGDALIRTGKIEAGRVCIAASVTLNPKNFPAVNQLAGINFSKGDFDQALLLYGQAESLHPFDATVKFNLGECLRKLKNDSMAVVYYQKALELDSTEARYAAQLGYSYFNLKRFDLSIAAYRRAIAIDKENPQYWLNLALVYQRMDSSQQVIDSFEWAVSASRPDKIADIYTELGGYQYRRKDYRAASQAYIKALTFEEHNTEAHFYLGMTYDQLKNPQNAIRHYQSYLKFTEGDTMMTQRRILAKQRIDWLKQH